MVELGGHVAQLHAAAAHRCEQFLDILARQRAELDAAEGSARVEARCARVELTRTMRAEDQDVAERHRQELGQQQQRVSIGPLQVVDRQHHRPIGRRVGYQPDGSAVQPAARIRCVEVRHLRGFAEHSTSSGTRSPRMPARADVPLTRSVRHRSRSAGPVASMVRTIVPSASPNADVRGRRAVPASPVGEHTVAPGDLEPEGLGQRRLAHAGSPAEQDATAAYASGLVHGGSEFGQLPATVDDTAVEVE